jgi:DNA-binding NarL/FixJ family response regulator
MRAGLRALLTTNFLTIDDLVVVGEAASLLNQEVALAEADVLIMASDDLLTDEVARMLTNNRNLALVVLSSDERITATLRMLRLRGWAIVSPEAPASELQAAVTAAAQGLIVLPTLLLDQLLGTRGPALVQTLDMGSDLPQEPLTSREQEVLEFLSQGLSNKMIARELQISEHTVKFHISSLYTKLGTSTRAEAVSRGARLGLITF